MAKAAALAQKRSKDGKSPFRCKLLSDPTSDAIRARKIPNLLCLVPLPKFRMNCSCSINKKYTPGVESISQQHFFLCFMVSLEFTSPAAFAPFEIILGEDVVLFPEGTYNPTVGLLFIASSCGSQLTSERSRTFAPSLFSL